MSSRWTCIRIVSHSISYNQHIYLLRCTVYWISCVYMHHAVVNLFWDLWFLCMFQHLFSCTFFAMDLLAVPCKTINENKENVLHRALFYALFIVLHRCIFCCCMRSNRMGRNTKRSCKYIKFNSIAINRIIYKIYLDIIDYL